MARHSTTEVASMNQPIQLLRPRSRSRLVAFVSALGLAFLTQLPGRAARDTEYCGDPEVLLGGAAGPSPANPFGDDTIGSLPVHGPADPAAVTDVYLEAKPSFYVEGTPDLLALAILDASGDQEAFVLAMPTPEVGRVRLYFVGDVQVSFQRRGFGELGLTFGVLAGLQFGDGLLGYRTANNYIKTSGFQALRDHSIALAAFESSGMLANSPLDLILMSQERHRSTLTFRDQGAAVVMTQKP